MNTYADDLFKLMILLIVVVYFAGFSTDVTSVKTAVDSTINVATGRNPEGGPFQPYPGGSSSAVSSSTLVPLSQQKGALF